MRGELDRVAIDRHPAGAGIETHGTAVEFAFGVAGGAPQQGAHARKYLFEMKRLGNIVIGARIEALDFVAPAVAGGEDQHRHRASGPPPGFQYRDAVHLRQADVEDHGVIRLGIAEEMALLAVEGAVYHVTRIGQGGGELTIEVRIILDNKKAQRLLRSAAAYRRLPYSAIPRNGSQQIATRFPPRKQTKRIVP